MSIPSFSSFPSFEPVPRPPSPSQSRNPEHSKEAKRKGDKGKRKRDKSDRTRSTDHSIRADERRKAEEDRKRSDEKPLYYSDRVGDPLNLRYGGLHAGDVPKYKLFAGGKKILGLSHAWTALYRSNKGVEVAVGSRRRMATLTDSSSRALLAAPPTRSMLPTDAHYKYHEIDGFLRLPSRRGRQTDQPYREITLAKNDSDSESSDNASSDGSSNDDSDSMTLTSHQQTLKSLEQQITSDPASVPTWLSLLSQTLSTVPHTSKNATKARSEIALSILSRALSSNPRNAASKELRLKHLKAGEEVWHESKLRAEWEDVLKIGAADVWMEWLEWRIRNAAKGIDGVVQDAQRALRNFGDSEVEEMAKLRVVWRVAVVLQNAGYMERATALFQAQAELTFEVPQSLYGLPLEILLDSLEEFWEAEVPRVGEAGAKGWAAWVTSGRPDSDPSLHPTTNPPTPPSLTPADPYSRWWREETTADRAQRMPARSSASDADADADPYATILFSDIRPLLLSLHSERAKHAFRMVWLSLLGLHVPGLSASLSPDEQGNWDDRWALTHLTSPACFAFVFPAGVETRISSDAHAGVIIGREKQYASGFGPVKHWGLGVIGPLESVGNQKCGIWTKDEVLGVDGGFVRRVFEQLRWGPQDVEWDCLTLAFEAALGVKSALKCSRAFLSVAQDSLTHWAFHARLERLRGRTEDGRKVYQTVLLTAPPPPASRAGTSQLWWDWAEMEWFAGRSDAALQVVLRAVGVEGTSGTTVLRAKRALEETFKGSGQMPWKDQEAWVKLRGLLELLTSGPVAALRVFDDYLLNDAGFSEGGVPHESLTVASLLVIYHHGVTLRNPTPPALLRERVEKAVDAYPSNTVILGMFLEAEKGRGVWGGVRALLGETTADGIGKDKDVPRRVAEVWVAGWEKGRWEAEKERTRSGLVAAVDNERTRGSPIIRRTFLEFEIRTGELQRAKKMLYGAIGACPLVKELYMLAFGPLRSVFSGHELNAFADTMAERGIRTRRGVDELLEGWEEEATADTDEPVGEELLEDNARELRRLMPY